MQQDAGVAEAAAAAAGGSKRPAGAAAANGHHGGASGGAAAAGRQLTPSQQAAQAAVASPSARADGLLPVRTGLAWAALGAPLALPEHSSRRASVSQCVPRGGAVLCVRIAACLPGMADHNTNKKIQEAGDVDILITGLETGMPVVSSLQNSRKHGRELPMARNFPPLPCRATR